MVDLRKGTQGENSMKGLNAVVLAYDNRSYNDKEGNLKGRFLDVRLHPEDRRAEGQTSLAFAVKPDKNAPGGYNNGVGYSAKQLDAIKEAAGDNVAPLNDKDGKQVGTIYGVKGDVFFSNNAAVLNTKTVEATDLSVQPNADGKSIQDQIFDKQRANKEAKAKTAEKSEAEAPALEAEKAEPAKKPAAKKPASRTRAKAAATKAAAEAKAAEAPAPEEPGLG